MFDILWNFRISANFYVPYCRLQLSLLCLFSRCNTWSINLTLKTIIDEIIEHKCVNADKGCDVKLKLTEIIDHEKDECHFQSISCPNGHCRANQIVVTMAKMEAHFRDQFGQCLDKTSIRRALQWQNERADIFQIQRQTVLCSFRDRWHELKIVGSKDDAENFRRIIRARGKGYTLTATPSGTDHLNRSLPRCVHEHWCRLLGKDG